MNASTKYEGGYRETYTADRYRTPDRNECSFCPGKHQADIRAIDAAMQTTKLTPTQRAEVIRYRNEGERMHNSGNHGAAEVALQKARSILKI